MHPGVCFAHARITPALQWYKLALPHPLPQVMDSSEVVVVYLNQLPEEPEELLEILAAEAAPLSTWYDFAKAYLAQGKEQGFLHICQEGTREEVVVEVERFFGSKPVYEQVPQTHTRTKHTHTHTAWVPRLQVWDAAVQIPSKVYPLSFPAPYGTRMTPVHSP